jgi:hypothetical protein
VFLPIGADFVFGPRDFNFKCAYGWIPVSVPIVKARWTEGHDRIQWVPISRRRNEKGQSNDNAV